MPIATKDFEAVIDLEHLMIGPISYSPPDFSKLVGIGKDYDLTTLSDNYREGFKCRVLLRNGAGDGVHEFSSTATQMWIAMDELHVAYEAGKAKHKNKLPVIGIAEFVKVETKTVAYRPVFVIKSWVPVPPELAAPAPTRKARAKAPAKRDDEDEELPAAFNR